MWILSSLPLWSLLLILILLSKGKESRGSPLWYIPLTIFMDIQATNMVSSSLIIVLALISRMIILIIIIIIAMIKSTGGLQRADLKGPCEPDWRIRQWEGERAFRKLLSHSWSNVWTLRCFIKLRFLGRARLLCTNCFQATARKLLQRILRTVEHYSVHLNTLPQLLHWNIFKYSGPGAPLQLFGRESLGRNNDIHF